MAALLSKSDYKVARTCPAKLYYRKLGLPTTLDDDPYLRLLAKGGFMVEEIARAQYPEGVAIGFREGREKALEDTAWALHQANGGDITLFEPTFVSKGRLIRVDIFRRVGKTIEVIEVKAKSWDSSKPGTEKGSFFSKNGRIRTRWEPYLEDVAFQMLALEDIFPDHAVVPYLLMPDLSKVATRAILHDRFMVEERVDPTRGYHYYEVAYNGDPSELQGDHFLTLVNASEAVEDLRETVDANWPAFVASLDPLMQIQRQLGTHCFACEYRTGGEDGFSMCWGAEANAEPHLVDLYYGSSYADVCILNGVHRIQDIDTSILTRRDGSIGSRNERQIIQIECTRSGEEWLGDGLADAMASHPYPHHFIDFETSTLAVPYHQGMRPYEAVAFQWSCHTVPEPGGPPVHSEWINTEDVFPNVDFAESLHAVVGDGGTLFTWAAHENTILRTIHRQMEERGYSGSVKEWIAQVASLKDGDTRELVDMHKICERHYLHPRMGKRTSIKNVLDAVWSEADWLRERFPEYGASESPYDGLPVVHVGSTDVDVADGPGAIQAYEAMMYGRERNQPAVKAQWRDALLRYCKLDTAAMVMIWWYWRRRLG